MLDSGVGRVKRRGEQLMSTIHRRKFLTMAGVSAVTPSLLAGCSGITSSEPKYSYETITGVWHGETPPGRRIHEWATVAFNSNQAAVGDEIGIVKFLEKKGGDVLCESTLTVRHSDPPTYWVDVQGGSFPCDTHQRYRFKHRPHEDREFGSRLLWFLTHNDEAIYHREALLTQKASESGERNSKSISF